MKGTNRRYAENERGRCVACGLCVSVCPQGAVTIWHGCYAVVEREVRGVRALRGSLSRRHHTHEGITMRHQRRHWYEYLWIASAAYFTLGFFNTLY